MKKAAFLRDIPWMAKNKVVLKFQRTQVNTSSVNKATCVGLGSGWSLSSQKHTFILYFPFFLLRGTWGGNYVGVGQRGQMVFPQSRIYPYSSSFFTLIVHELGVFWDWPPPYP